MIDNRKEGGYQVKTAYKIMMQTLSWPVYKTKPAAAVGCFSSNLMRAEIYNSFTGATDAGASTALSQRSGH